MSRKKGAASEGDRAGWRLYILQCSDGSYYTGITTDIERRLQQHQEGTASRYTRSRRPVKLVYTEACAGRSQALSREHAVKSLPRRSKHALILGSPSHGDHGDPGG